MHKTILPDINARMVDNATLSKNDQISRTHFIHRHRLPPVLKAGNRAWRDDSSPCLVHMSNQTTAIKPTFGRIAPKAVRGADQANRVDRDIGSLLGA